jgi:hypothetical protein
MAAILTIAGLGAFVLSHVIGSVIGAWPAVLLVAAATGMLYWRVSDSRQISLPRRAAGVRTGP